LILFVIRYDDGDDDDDDDDTILIDSLIDSLERKNVEGWIQGGISNN